MNFLKHLNHFLLLGLVLLSACDSSPSSSSAGGGGGQSGSLSRFALHNNVLYAISGSSEVKVFDISNADQPLAWQTVPVNFGIETLHVNNNRLYIGANNGMYIYDISSPQTPEYRSRLLHVRACDPVVVQGNTAYVTLRGGTSCTNAANNQLDIIDVSDIMLPRLISSFRLTAPKGLAVNGDYVYVCDGWAGLKVLNVNDPLNINVLYTYPLQTCNDVIATNQDLISSGDVFLSQFNLTTLPLEHLSTINIDLSQPQ